MESVAVEIFSISVLVKINSNPVLPKLRTRIGIDDVDRRIRNFLQSISRADFFKYLFSTHMSF